MKALNFFHTDWYARMAVWAVWGCAGAWEDEVGAMVVLMRMESVSRWMDIYLCRGRLHIVTEA